MIFYKFEEAYGDEGTIYIDLTKISSFSVSDKCITIFLSSRNYHDVKVVDLPAILKLNLIGVDFLTK